MRFTQRKYGKCDRCGNTGYDEEDSVVMNSMLLKDYNGDLLCPICINELKDIEQGEIVTDKINETQEFLDSMGVTD